MSEIRIDVYVDNNDIVEAAEEIEAHLAECGIMARVER